MVSGSHIKSEGGGGGITLAKQRAPSAGGWDAGWCWA